MGKNNKNILIFVTGIILIIIVVFLYFFQFHTNKQQDAFSQEIIQKKEQDYDFISVQALQEKIKQGEKIQIIDTRKIESFKLEHILDSLNIPIDEIKNYSKEINSSVFLLIEDGTDPQTLQNTAQELKEKNVKKISIIDGGAEAWKQNGGITVQYGNPTQFSDQSKVEYISQEDLRTKLDKNETVFILDVREKEEFEKGHLPKAKNIPLNELEKRRFEIPSMTPIAIYSNIELEAFQASTRIYDMRMITSSTLKGGYLKWVENKFNTEK